MSFFNDFVDACRFLFVTFNTLMIHLIHWIGYNFKFYKILFEFEDFNLNTTAVLDSLLLCSDSSRVSRNGGFRVTNGCALPLLVTVDHILLFFDQTDSAPSAQTLNGSFLTCMTIGYCSIRSPPRNSWKFLN